MNDSVNGSPNEQQADIESFSQNILLDTKSKFSQYLFSIVVFIIGFYVLLTFAGFHLSFLYAKLLDEHGASSLQAQFSKELSCAQSIVTQEKKRLISAVATLSQTITLMSTTETISEETSLEGEGDQTKTGAFEFTNEQFNLISESLMIDIPLDFLYGVDLDGVVLYSTSNSPAPRIDLASYQLVQQAFEGKTSGDFRSEKKMWLEGLGLKLLSIEAEAEDDDEKQEQNSEVNKEKGEESPPPREEVGLLMVASAPLFIGEKVAGAVLGGYQLGKDRWLVEKLKKLLLKPNDKSSFIALLQSSKRISSTFISKKGYIENTQVPGPVLLKTLQQGMETVNKINILNTDFYAGYIPLKADDNQIVGALEIGYDYQKIFRPYDKLYRMLKKRFYILIILTSILCLVIAYAISLKISSQLFETLSSMTQKITVLIGKIANASRKVKETSAEILASSEEQSAYFSQQAASITETTATMEELATVTKQIANYAEEVVKVAQQTTTNAETGYDSVLNTISSMKEIKKKNETSAQEIISLGDKSQKIGQVMRFINGIASQTKLIAFNASIEASAAGNIGKRFGVVATEVRRLAEDVVKSTDDIKRIITEIQKSTNRLVFVSEEETKKIDEGVLLSEGSGDALQKILKIVSKTNQAARQISLITQQQRTASDQVVTALKEINIGANESVKVSKHINKVITELDELSDEMNRMIGKSAKFIEQT
ncbi:methyl-accepting chemotaxis protein [candidate division CSSED10-310 bacterium]|uniref:Methyl-accepting chemotaxis protein n=1 Tax=candidate division CSSED10-310 bacterium TaxID=2855610 RepID=A0ABV6YRX4_UNCC1